MVPSQEVAQAIDDFLRAVMDDDMAGMETAIAKMKLLNKGSNGPLLRKALRSIGISAALRAGRKTILKFAAEKRAEARSKD